MTPSAPVEVGSGREARVAAWVAIVAVVAGLGLAPPWQLDAGIPEGFAGRLVAGDLEWRDGEVWAEVGGGELVPDAAEVRSSGGARLAVPGGRLGLGAESEASLDDPLELTRGALLVEVDDRERRIVLGPVLAVGRGIWRVDADGAPRVAVYDGGVAVRPADADSGGLPVGRLHQADLTGDVLPGESLPLRYDVTDPWDARLLVDALEIDRQTEQLRRSLHAQHGDERRPASFYRSFAIVDDAVAAALAQFAGDDLGPPADVLLHLVAVDLLRTVRRLDVDEATDRVARLRGAGATWGVVLTLHDLDAEDLRAGLDLSLREESALAAPITSAPGDEPTTTPTPPADPGDEEPPPPGPPPPEDDEDPVVPCEGEGCDEANDLADDLLDLIDEIDPDDDPDGGKELEEALREEQRELEEALREAERERREGEREDRRLP